MDDVIKEHDFDPVSRLCRRCKRELWTVVTDQHPCEEWYDEVKPNTTTEVG